MPHISKEEHFIDTPSGMTIYAVEKRLSNAIPRRAVLLIHGSGVGYACWDIEIKDYSLMEFLAGEGWDVFAVDLRGYGRSTKSDEMDVTLEPTTDDLKSVIEFIRNLRGIKTIDVIGHSRGGMIATMLAGKYSDYVGGIVLIGTPYRMLNPYYQSMLNKQLELNKVGYSPNLHHREIEKMLCSYEPEVANAYRAMNDRLYPELPEGIRLDLRLLSHAKYIPAIANPTLLINGTLDGVIVPDDAMKCLNDLTAKQKALLFVGNCGHHIYLEEMGHRIVHETILDWLRQ